MELNDIIPILSKFLGIGVWIILLFLTLKNPLFRSITGLKDASGWWTTLAVILELMIPLVFYLSGIINNFVFLIILLILFAFSLNDIIEKNPYDLINNYGVLIKSTGVIGIGSIVMMMTMLPKNDTETPDKASLLKVFLLIANLLLFAVVTAVVITSLVWLGSSNIGIANAISTTLLGLIVLIASTLVVTLGMNQIKEFFNWCCPTFSYANLIFQIISYIPCGILDIFKALKHQYKITTSVSWLLILAEIILIALYFGVDKFKKYVNTRDGKILLHEPTYLNNEKVLGTYEFLNEVDGELTREDLGDKKPIVDVNISGNEMQLDIIKNKTTIKTPFTYNYALSSWIYLNPVAPSTCPADEDWISLLNYGNKPNILYNTRKNCMRIMMQYEANKSKVIYDINNIKLQKWNHLLINYSGGTLDVFLNGKLQSSTSGTIPYISADTVSSGQNHGVSGGISQVIYYPKSLSIQKIEGLYNSYKNINPPII